MNQNAGKTKLIGTPFIEPPAYPFGPRVLWGELRAALSKEDGKKVTYCRLGEMMGEGTSNAHFWVCHYEHPQLLAFMCLLERLSAGARHAYIEAHCRVCPVLDHRRLFYPKGMRQKVGELVEKEAGLTIITGGTDSMRSFMVTALGHAFVRRRGRPIAGLDIHRPVKLVPVSGVLHLDQKLDSDQIRSAALKILPRLLVSNSAQVVFNGVWSGVPEVREDIHRLARHKHVVIADPADNELNGLSESLALPVSLVRVSPFQRRKEGIQVICRQQKSSWKRR